METREGEGLPLSGIAIILLLLGAFFLRETPLTGSRPGGLTVPSDVLGGAQRVPARLWQDPVGAVRRFRVVQSGQKADAVPGAPVIEFGGLEFEAAKGFADFDTLAKEVARSLSQDKKDVTVLGVAVFGGPYAEDREMRLRTRYAVLSALGELAFEPEDSAHIGYVGLPRPEPPALTAITDTASQPERAAPRQVDSSRAAGTAPADETPAPVQASSPVMGHDIIPYEWLNSPEQRVLLLWLEEELLAGEPLWWLASLVKKFRATTEANAQAERGKLQFSFQAPASSGTLAEMLEETQRPHWAGTSGELQDVAVLSPSATASDWRLADASRRAKELKEQGIGEFMRRDGAAPLLVRTIATDQAVADAVLDELERRGIEIICDQLRAAEAPPQNNPPCQRHRDHIVLLAEWDTFYGRAMPDAFSDALGLRHRNDWLSAPREIPWVHRASFLRGLDGKLPGEAFSNNRAIDNSAGGGRRSRSEAERPVGTSQFDYLRRLAQRIQKKQAELRRTGEGRVAAIGILGSDVYDKLLILQALRPAFPGTVFFTTDLDARLLEPSQFAWTRNLIVASSFGLALHPDLQRTVPPFRDSYQSARFLSTLMAFGGSPRGTGATDAVGRWAPGLVKECLEPRLFEVGRNGAYHLSGPASGDACIRPLHPVLESPPFPARGFLLGLLAMALGGMLLFHYLYPIRERWAYYRLNMPLGVRLGALGVQGFYLLAIGIILTLGIWQSRVLGEPFSIHGGVSVVPTEVLRLLAGLLAVHFALESWRIIRQNNEDLAQGFCLEAPRHIERSEKSARISHKWPRRLLPRLWLAYRRRNIYHWRNTRRRLTRDVAGRGLEPPVPVTDLWRRYQRLGLFRNRFLRYLPWAALFMAFSFVLIQLFGEPSVPARGPWSSGLDKLIIVGLTVVPFLLLLIGVVDATRLCIELVRWFVDARVIWPKGACRIWEERFGMKTEELREWLAVQFVAQRTEAIGRLVYFPFIVIFLMIISRSTYFDHWDMPVGLIVVIVSSALYAVLSAFALRKTAEQMREAALANLQERLTMLAGTDRERESRQLELLMGQIREIRRGAFRPWRQQPVLKALLWFIGGTSITGLEFFSVLG